VTRQVDYTWRLREIMAAHGLFATTELVPLLRDRGIDLSASQVHRLVTGIPERLSLHVLAALCDIFDTTPAELITTTAANAGVRRAAAINPCRPTLLSYGPSGPASPQNRDRLAARGPTQGLRPL
jgi:DNA-binding Xre family transcriptional regulator